MKTVKTFCRVCHVNCAIDVDVDGDRVVAVRGDRDDPVYRGFTCTKGRQLPDLVHHPERLHRPMRRTSSGDFEEIALADALDEIAERLTTIIDRDGPRAVAAYVGTFASLNPPTWPLCRSWLDGIGSPGLYTSATLDQPAKWFVAPYRHGVWAAGLHEFETSDVVMIVGSNPLVSLLRTLPAFDPYRRLQEARRRGLQVICIDPRRTELANLSTIHLPVRPGEDVTLLAGIVREILAHDLHDAEFCAAHTEGLDDLRQAVEPFTPDYVEQRARVPSALMIEAAHLFARGPRGAVASGTGSEMGRHPSVTEHLVLALNSICGRYKRAGETISNPGVLAPSGPRRAQAVVVDVDLHDTDVRPRVRGLAQLNAFGGMLPPREMPTAALADEILIPGEGQVRALISIGGGPMTALPNQAKVQRALAELELYVQIDIKLSPSARRAHYVLPGKVCLERGGATGNTDRQYPVPYARYTEPVVEPGPDLLDEWEFLWEISRRMGTPLELAGSAVPFDHKPDRFELLSLAFPNSRVPLAELRSSGRAQVFDFSDVVLPAEPGPTPRLRLAPREVTDELAAIRAEPIGVGAGYGDDADRFSHRLISRRLVQAYNSACHDLPRARARGANLAYMNPDDLAQLGVVPGDLVQIRSAVNSIPAVVAAAPDVPTGVISMSHGWGDGPDDDARVREIGSPTNRLVDDEHHFDPVTGIPLQSAIPVNVSVTS